MNRSCRNISGRVSLEFALRVDQVAGNRGQARSYGEVMFDMAIAPFVGAGLTAIIPDMAKQNHPRHDSIIP